MTEQELKKLGKQELIKLLLDGEKEKAALAEELSKLRSENAALQEKLDNKLIELDEAGSIAEAAMRVNGVFDAVEAAAEQYLDSIRALSERQEQLTKKLMEDTKRKAKAMLEEAMRQRDDIVREADTYWDEMSGRLENFYEEHKGLRELLQLEVTKE